MEEAAPPTLVAPLDLTGLPPDQLRSAPDGWYVVLRLGGATHRLWLEAEPIERVGYHVKLSLDDDFETRDRAAQRLWRALNDRPLGPALDDLTPQRRARLELALRALDGRQEGASYRAIAEGLFGPVRISARAWKTHDLRSRTIRLVQMGLDLMRGGYRDLLRLRRRER